MYKLSAHLSYKIVVIGSIIGIGLALALLIILATLVRYTSFVRAHPVKFMVEVVFSGMFAAVPIFMIAYHRRALHRKTLIDFALLSVKFSMFYMLFELSGVNAILFAERF